MGISPIQYRPWNRERSAQNLRVYVILKSVFKHGLKSIWVKVLLILGFFLLFAFPMISMILQPHERLEAEEMSTAFNGFSLAIFAMLLAAVVTSDLISDDLSSNSFVLYFSRALKPKDYLMGKAGGVLIIMGLLCFIPPLLMAFAATLTQSSDDYWSSIKVIGRTIVAGVLATAFFVPFGIMMSSFTRKKSYAAIGTFMSFFVLAIVASVFSAFAAEWRVISPVESLAFTFDWIYGISPPSYLGEGALVAFLALFIIVPAVAVYFRIERLAVGK
jgi:ABC-type transport system involved in multi-copper enzyme maturation permease subunit